MCFGQRRLRAIWIWNNILRNNITKTQTKAWNMLNKSGALRGHLKGANKECLKSVYCTPVHWQGIYLGRWFFLFFFYFYFNFFFIIKTACFLTSFEGHILSQDVRPDYIAMDYFTVRGGGRIPCISCSRCLTICNCGAVQSRQPCPRLLSGELLSRYCVIILETKQGRARFPAKLEKC